MLNLGDSAKVIRAANAAVSGTSAVTSSGVDCRGFDDVLFACLLGSTADATTTIKLQASSDDASVDAYDDVEGTLITAGASAANKMLLVNVPQPRKRWLRAVVTRSGGASIIDGVLCILASPKVLPVLQGTTVAAGETHPSPAEGTA